MYKVLKNLSATTSALALIMTFIPTQSASAAFPGLNGRIVFYSSRDGDSEIYTMRLDGSDVKQLTNNSVGDSYPTWSPDGTKIVFTSARDVTTEIYSMNSDGTNQTRLTNSAAIKAIAAYSRDGSKIVYRSDQDGNNEIYTMNADGTNQTRVTNNVASDTNAKWSPQSDTIVFQRSTGIRTILPDGSNDTAFVGGNNPRWKASGDRIIYNQAVSGDQEIVTRKTDGSDLQILTASPGVDTTADFSADDTKIVFVSARDGNDEIYSMNSDGTNQIRLTNNAVSDVQPMVQPLTIPPTTINPNLTLNATQGSVTYNAPANHTDTYETIDPTSVTITSQPQKGSVSVNNTTGEITYTPNQHARVNFNLLAFVDNLFFPSVSAQSANQDSFAYQICSTANSQLCTTVTVTVDLATANLASTGTNPTTLTVVAYAMGGVGGLYVGRWLKRKKAW